jgi:hypothetical protein
MGTASAGSINGSLPFAGIGVAINGADLASSTIINATVYETSGAGAGDYSNVPQLSNFTEGGGLDLTNLGAFNFTNAIGTFQANAALSFIVTQQSGFLDVFLRGTFTPGAGAPAPLLGEDPTDTSFRLAFTKSGSSVSGSGTLSSPAVPPPGVPEPATMALMGSALLGLGLFGRKRLSGK